MTSREENSHERWHFPGRGNSTGKGKEVGRDAECWQQVNNPDGFMRENTKKGAWS